MINPRKDVFRIARIHSHISRRVSYLVCSLIARWNPINRVVTGGGGISNNSILTIINVYGPTLQRVNNNKQSKMSSMPNLLVSHRGTHLVHRST